jgi:hypothetical protein
MGLAVERGTEVASRPSAKVVKGRAGYRPLRGPPRMTTGSGAASDEHTIE